MKWRDFWRFAVEIIENGIVMFDILTKYKVSHIESFMHDFYIWLFETGTGKLEKDQKYTILDIMKLVKRFLEETDFHNKVLQDLQNVG